MLYIYVDILNSTITYVQHLSYFAQQGSIEEWLRLLRLDEYIVQLQNEGFQSVRDVTKLNEEDLEDIGIVKLGHQKKILLAIKRVKEIVNGKSVVPCINYCCQPPTNNMLTSANGAIFQQVCSRLLERNSCMYNNFIFFLLISISAS